MWWGVPFSSGCTSSLGSWHSQQALLDKTLSSCMDHNSEIWCREHSLMQKRRLGGCCLGIFPVSERWGRLEYFSAFPLDGGSKGKTHWLWQRKWPWANTRKKTKNRLKTVLQISQWYCRKITYVCFGERGDECVKKASTPLVGRLSVQINRLLEKRK